MTATRRSILSAVVCLGGVVAGRWLGYAWPVAALLGVALMLIVGGLTRHRHTD